MQMHESYKSLVLNDECKLKILNPKLITNNLGWL